MGKQQTKTLSTLLLLLVLSEHRSSRAAATGRKPSLSGSGGLELPKGGLQSSGHIVSYDTSACCSTSGYSGACSGSMGRHGRHLRSQTCIGVSGSGRIGCGLQWGLPSCCDSNPNTNSGYNCQPNTPFDGCPPGKYAACCTLF